MLVLLRNSRKLPIDQMFKLLLLNAVVACHLPEHCVATTCTRSDDYQCTKCQSEKSTAQYSVYWPNPDKKVCEGMFCFSSLCSSLYLSNSEQLI